VENSGNVFDTFCVTDVDMTDNALCKMILNESLQMNIHNTISQRQKFVLHEIELALSHNFGYKFNSKCLP
jgi:hypothetical protein